MFKKLIVAAIAILGISTAAMARDLYTRDASVLPQAAKMAVNDNFKAGVSMVKVDKNFGHIADYEVILTDGTEITFDRNGNWQNVEVALNGTIPSAFIPTEIANYVAQNQAGQKIVGIERERTGYDVELANGVDIRFNSEGKFIRFED